MEEKKPRILVCVLTTQERTGWVCKHLDEWLHDLKFKPDYQTSVGHAHNFSPAAGARNYIFQLIKDMDEANRPDWLLMIDNDMVPPDNLLDTIKGAPEDAGVLVPRFYMWDENKASVVLCWGMDPADAPVEEDGRQIFKVMPGKHYQLTKAGTGAIFIRPQLIDELTKPYFWYTYNEDGAMTGTEDINFCKKVLADTKWKIYGVSDIEVGHYHNVNLALLAKWLYAVESSKGELAEFPAPAECFR